MMVNRVFRLCHVMGGYEYAASKEKNMRKLETGKSKTSIHGIH